MTTTTPISQVLDALNQLSDDLWQESHLASFAQQVDEIIAALSAIPVQEPVAWKVVMKSGAERGIYSKLSDVLTASLGCDGDMTIPLYASPLPADQQSSAPVENYSGCYFTNKVDVGFRLQSSAKDALPDGARERERFEKWAEFCPYKFDLDCEVNPDKTVVYMQESTRHAWSAWQAATRQAVPELRNITDVKIDEFSVTVMFCACRPAGAFGRFIQAAAPAVQSKEGE